MSEFGLLRDLVVIFAAAVVVVAALRRVGLPPIAGFIVAGILAGPGALGIIGDTHQIEVLAEVGVVLLLFGIGLELSLDRVRRLWRPIIIGGLLQMGLTVLAATAAARGFGIETRSAIFLGCVIAVSSTAIVLRGLSTRGELDTPHGRLSLGILVFQDLSVVPLVLLVPLLTQGSAEGQPEVELGKGVALLAGVLIAERLLVPRLLEAVARTQQRELFVLSVATVCLGTAWVAASIGVSLALGAFLAGLVVASSEYRHQAMAEIVPMREVLASVFFISVGLLLDTQDVWGNAVAILATFGAIVVGKFGIVVLTAWLMRLPLRVCLLTGAALAQVGEFSFVLLRKAGGAPFLGPYEDSLMVAIVLSMLVTPLLIALGPRFAAGAANVRWLTHLLQVETPEESRTRSTFRGHVIVAGYGLAGEQVAKVLRNQDLPYVVVDLNPDNVRNAALGGEPALYGDIANVQVLHDLNVAQARGLVVAINDADAAHRAVRAARQVAPDLCLLARAAYMTDVKRLRDAGATDVVVAEMEAARKLAQMLAERTWAP